MSRSRALIEGDVPESPYGELDKQARAGLQAAGDLVLASVQAEAPKRSHVMVDSYDDRVAKTKTGYRLTVAPKRSVSHGGPTAAEVARWVNRGTGLYREGPGPKFRIRPRIPGRKLRLPGGRRVRSVRGQRANPFVARGREASEQAAMRAIDQAAGAAVRNLVGR